MLFDGGCMRQLFGSSMLKVGAACAAAILISWNTTGQATDLTTQRVASGLSLPLFVISRPGDPGTIFVLEQSSGLIRIVRNGQVLARPFLNIHDRVSPDGGERGLLGMAFHPNYLTNGYFYLNYIDLSGNTVISRFQVTSDPDSADAGSEHLLLPIVQPFANHNGSMLAFGPNDGYLYIGMGDGGSAGDPLNNAQNDSTLLGKILRIDVDNGQPYGIPASNPFVGIPGKRGEIWAKGMRNPWRYSFDRQTADLFIGDVGQDLWEEIDFQSANDPGGENYGWRLMEGDHCYNPPVNCDPGGLTYPIYEYDHTNGCAITGGYVYRGGIIPQLDGTYFFGDFCSARIWSFRYDGHNMTEFTERTTELAPGNGQSIGSISSFGEDGYGELYIADLNGGEVFKVVPRNPGAVTGRVTDGANQGIPGAIVSVQRTGLQDTTGADGAYLLNGLGDGAFDLRFVHPLYKDTVLAGVAVISGDTTVANMILSPQTGTSSDNQLPMSFKLYQNYPNPFNAVTRIDYDLGKASRVKINIFNVAGDRITTLVDGPQEIGNHQVLWDGASVSSGVYFYQINTGDFQATKRMLLLK